MTAHIVITCNGTRSGQPCRGALHTGTLDLPRAAARAEAAGWTTTFVAHPARCPSSGHDEPPDG